MDLIPCTDNSAAAWIAEAGLPWQQLATFGPAEFPAYVRLRFATGLSTDSYLGITSATDRADTELSEAAQLRLAVTLLMNDSREPKDLYVSFWEGSWGSPFSGATFRIPERSYSLYSGSFSNLGNWSISSENVDREEPVPAFVWPVDHAWCIADDVDPGWAGVGGSTEAIQRLIDHPRLDAVAADPSR